MKFAWCTILVKDMEESLKFYRDVLGLPLNRRFSGGPGREISFVGEGDTKIELICEAGRAPAGKPGGITLGFVVDSLEQTMAYLRDKGVKIDSGPFRPNPHIQYIFVSDPDGVKVQFAENL